MLNNNTHSPSPLAALNLKLNKVDIQLVDCCSNNYFLTSATVQTHTHTHTLYANAPCVVNISGLDQTISLISNYLTTMNLAI